MNVGIVGLGLIGGSLAKSIKKHSEHTVWGFDIDSDAVTQALMCGAIDETLTDALLPQCDVVLVALYPGACVRYIEEHAEAFAPGALVIDCAGVKRSVYEPVSRIAEGRGWTYIGGHPMAGREFSGFRHATGTLFARASMILTPMPDADIETLEAAKTFFLEVGFKAVRITTPEEHDRMISYTSQLAHIVSSAYVKCPLADKHRGFSAGSFADMTRVARLNEAMWTELFFDNREALLPVVEDLVQRVTEYRDALRDQDEEAMMRLLREGRETKERLTEA